MEHDVNALAQESVQDDASETTLLDDDNHLQGSTPEQRIEAKVLDFLSQLATTTAARNNHSEQESSSQRSTARPRLELRLTNRQSGEYRSLRYPRKSARGSARPFAQVFRILDLSHDAILRGTPVTKRDIYYNDVALFQSQRVVDGLVDDLAATMDLERANLHIRAASKGLVCGASLIIHLWTNEHISCNDTEGTLIPAGEDIKSFEVVGEMSWVLIVEKEAIFQTLCRSQLSKHTALPGPGLIITGKGYPDIATRHFVRTLSDHLPSNVPILALVDGDPHGIDIMSTYKFGSQSLAHESDKLAAGRVKWLGLWASELTGFCVDKSELLPMTKHDERKALSMLQRVNPRLPRRWRKELMHMSHNRRKAEIEVLSAVPTLQCPEQSEADEKISACRHHIAHESKSGIQPPLLRYLLSKITMAIDAAPES